MGRCSGVQGVTGRGKHQSKGAWGWEAQREPALEPQGSILYPRVKANATEDHRNACGSKESTTQIVGKCSLPPLSSPVSCRSSCGSDRASGGTSTCPVPPAPSQGNSSSCCSHTRSQLAQNLPSAQYLSLAVESVQPCSAVLSSREIKARCQGRARKDTHRAAVGPDLSALSYKQGSSHSSDKSPIASALEPAVHHRHHLAAS